MNILIIARGIPSKKYPQLGCFELDQAKALKKAGHNVRMIALDGSIGKRWKKIGITKKDIEGILCFELFGPPTVFIRKFIGLKKGLDIEIKLYKILVNKILQDGWKPNIIHAHYLQPIYIGTNIKNMIKAPLIGTEHLSNVTKNLIEKEILSLIKLTYPNVNEQIAVSETLKNKIKEYSSKDSVVIHNLIDTSKLLPALEKTNNNCFTIVAVGSLIKRKGFDILIDAFSKSYLKDLNVIVKIIGGGKEQINLQNQINQNRLQDKIKLVGTMTKPEVFNELHNADLFVLPSRLENFSVAIIEATANGLPTIATLCGGVEEYPVKEVKKIQKENVDELREALEEMYEKRESFDRKSIQSQTLKYFSPEVIVKQLEELYHKTIDEYKKNG